MQLETAPPRQLPEDRHAVRRQGRLLNNRAQTTHTRLVQGQLAESIDPSGRSQRIPQSQPNSSRCVVALRNAPAEVEQTIAEFRI